MAGETKKGNPDGRDENVIAKIIESAKRNHLAQMAICCLLPVLLIIALQLLGYTGFWVYALALALCIGSHIAMAAIGAKKEGQSCH
ncbi:MAG: hypothetical protein HY394_02260 [Candidatus Diapherotrites archaeon]|nr:hypothetical protein [Candidatus Diapherotrites archaeon]